MSRRRDVDGMDKGSSLVRVDAIDQLHGYAQFFTWVMYAPSVLRDPYPQR